MQAFFRRRGEIRAELLSKKGLGSRMSSTGEVPVQTTNRSSTVSTTAARLLDACTEESPLGLDRVEEDGVTLRGPDAVRRKLGSNFHLWTAEASSVMEMVEVVHVASSKSGNKVVPRGAGGHLLLVPEVLRVTAERSAEEVEKRAKLIAQVRDAPLPKTGKKEPLRAVTEQTVKGAVLVPGDPDFCTQHRVMRRQCVMPAG